MSAPTEASSQLDRNKALLRRLNDEVINGGDVDVLAELFSPELVHARRGLSATFRTFGSPPPTGSLAPRERFARGFLTIHSAFPDWYTTIEQQVAEGDVVVERLHVTGTHRAPFLGIPATGRRVELNEVVIFTIRDDRVVGIWGISDEVDLWQQLGVLDGGTITLAAGILPDAGPTP